MIRSLSFEVFKGATLAIIGESGSGKSITCRALLGLLPAGARAAGSVRYNGKEFLGLSEKEIRRHRGKDIGMVFQDSERALNPTMQIGSQISEAVRCHEKISAGTARTRMLELLRLLRFPDPKRLSLAYPHELSGGMRQRVMIGVAIASNPGLLVADEPTSSLDVSTGTEIMQLLMDLQRQLEVALIWVSHDLRLVATFADSVLVMQAGRGIEHARTANLLTKPESAYTTELLQAISSLNTQATSVGDPPLRIEELTRDKIDPTGRGTDVVVQGRRPQANATQQTAPLLEVQNLEHHFSTGAQGRRRGLGLLRALCGVSFSLMPGETLGLVGETGAGKSTLVRAILQIPKPSRGSVRFQGRELTSLRGNALKQCRRHIQMVFQDPFASVNPKWRVREIVEEPLIGYRYGNRKERRQRVETVLNLVGLPIATYGSRRPGQLSGGQCQRVAIARALAPEPRLLVCDEPLSSLDALTQKRMVSLFQHLRSRLNVAFLFISHDLARITEISDRVLVMYMGQFCEMGPTDIVCRQPFHPYMAMLIASARFKADVAARLFSGESPSQSTSPRGCRFHPRCERAQERCRIEEPRLRTIAKDHLVACHYAAADDIDSC